MFNCKNQRGKKWALAFCLGIFLSLNNGSLWFNKLPPVYARDVRPDVAAEKVYQLIPELPLENEYISPETKEIARKNTLINRFIRYHQYVKNRPLRYRLDWQLTIADYFQLNEVIREERYPGNKTLTVNPLEGDRIAIKGLSRIERNKLIDTLVEIYNPVSQSSTEKSQEPTNNNSVESDRSTPFPQRGGADLLR